jgi:anti-sigma factor RsiW
MEGFRGPDLTRAILARTTGGSCEALRAQACAYVDGELEPLQADLVAAHLTHCPACTALVAALRAAEVRLPALRAADPGPWFTQRVLRACRPAPAPSLWSRLLQRPRFALEAAYVGAALGYLLLSLPLPGRPEGLGAEPVKGLVAATKPGIGALAGGLHAMAGTFKTREPKRSNATEPGRGAPRPSH